MKKYNMLFLSVCVLSCVGGDAYAALHKSWTVLVYMACADERGILRVLDDIEGAGSGDRVNVLVYCTMCQDDNKKHTKRLYAKSGGFVQVGPTLERDAGDVATLAEALLWAALDYPSDYLAVVLMGQGSGPLNRNHSEYRGICYDSESGNYLTDRDCFNALSWICNYVRGGKKIDIIACDVNYGASIEMAYTLSSFADFFVACQGKSVDGGFQYSEIINALKRGGMLPFNCAKTMVTSYSRGRSAGDVSFSLIDLRDITRLVDNINAVAQILSSYSRGKNADSVKEIVKRAVRKNVCATFDEGVYVDIQHFYKNLIKNVSDLRVAHAVSQQLKRILAEGIELVGHMVRAQVVSKAYKQPGGISIYFARHSIDPSYYGLHWTVHNPTWLTLLEGLIGP